MDDNHKVINFKNLARQADIPPVKVYNNLKGRYNSFTDEDKSKLANTLVACISPFLDTLGFSVKLQ